MARTISTLTIWTTEQKQAVALVVGEGYTQDEAAKTLGVERSTVAKRLAAAYKAAWAAKESGQDVAWEVPDIRIHN